MKNLSFYILAAVLGVLAGILSALSMAGLIGERPLDAFASVNVNDWGSDWSIGTTATDPYMRARIARHGLLALSKQEAIYFIRFRDDHGDQLNEACNYELTGTRQQSMWWSITLYDRANRLPMNDDNALSVDATSFDNSENWSVIVASEKPNNLSERQLWLSSDEADQFDLTLRIYRPSQALLDNPTENLNPPNIKRISCRKGLAS